MSSPQITQIETQMILVLRPFDNSQPAA